MLSYAVGGFLSGMIGDRMRMSTVIAGGLAGSAVCVLLLAGGAAEHLLQTTVRVHVRPAHQYSSITGMILQY